MQIVTKYFGELEWDEKDIITFKEGLPGFLGLQRFIIIHDEGCFSYLQSIDNQALCFVIVPPALFVENYDIEISETAVAKLEIEKPEDVLLYAIVTVPENVNEMTANLKAPVLINLKNNQALQEILDDVRFEIKHKIVKEA